MGMGMGTVMHLYVSMQRLSTTNAVTPKGRIINSCTVDHQTVFMLIMETQVSKLTLSHTPEQNRVGWFQSQTPERVKVINGHPKANLGTCHQPGLNP